MALALVCRESDEFSVHLGVGLVIRDSCHTWTAVKETMLHRGGPEYALEDSGRRRGATWAHRARLYFSGLFNMELVRLPEFCTSSSILELSSWTKAGVQYRKVGSAA